MRIGLRSAARIYSCMLHPRSAGQGQAQGSRPWPTSLSYRLPVGKFFHRQSKSRLSRCFAASCPNPASTPSKATADRAHPAAQHAAQAHPARQGRLGVSPPSRTRSLGSGASYLTLQQLQSPADANRQTAPHDHQLQEGRREENRQCREQSPSETQTRQGRRRRRPTRLQAPNGLRQRQAATQRSRQRRRTREGEE